MFNWLKNKLNKYVPSEINNNLMSYNFCKVKVGDKITLPDNVYCLITYKDKIYKKLNPGSFILNEELLTDLYKRQQNKQNYLSRFKIDFFFINTKSKDFNFNFYYSIPVNKRLTKFNLNLTLNVNIVDAVKFSNFVRSEFAYTNASEVNNYFGENIEYLTKKFFLKKQLKDYYIDNTLKDNFYQYLTHTLSSIGVNINNIQLSESCKYKINKSSNFNFTADDINNKKITNNIEVEKENSSNLVDKPNTIVYNEKSSTEKVPEKPKQDICPKCNMKIIKGSMYCIRCGYKF